MTQTPASKGTPPPQRGLARRTMLAAGIALPATAWAGWQGLGETSPDPKETRIMNTTEARSVDRTDGPVALTIRRASDRGFANHGWLRSYHTFSFADYHDPEHMGFHSLRVINEDRVEPSKGFGTHPHRDMEIISYVLEGELQHRDSMGNGSVIRPGDVQRMTAGTGVTHSEFNASSNHLVHFLQIWILPERRGLTPGYEQKPFAFDDHKGELLLIASRDGRAGSVTIHQDARVYAGRFDEGQGTRVEVAAGRHAWVHVARGTLTLGGERLLAGDAASMEGPCAVELSATSAAEALVFDLG